MIKIDIVSGFLGAGKTTFIKKMVEEVYRGEKIALIENEFGEVGIDGGFLKDAGIQITEMNSGCICCSLVGDFGKNLKEVVTVYKPERIIIEPSGVGKLSDVMKSVIDLEKEQDIALGALVTIVNAKKASKQRKAFGEFFQNQIAFATTIVLSRTQSATAEQLELCVKQMKEINKDAAVITTPWDDISGAQIAKVIEGQDSLERKLLAEEKAHKRRHDHAHSHEHGEDCDCHHSHGHGEDGDCHHSHAHSHAHGEDCDCRHSHAHSHEHGEDCDCHHSHAHGKDGAHNHEHGEDCGCHHSHEHGEDGDCHHSHAHHHADEIFTSWGVETPHKFTKEEIETAVKALTESEEYGEILRAKGMVENKEGDWIYFDMTPGEYEIRTGNPDYTGRICVIGIDLEKRRLEELFGID